MKYYIITYGCQMNRSDSERIAAVLEKIGYKPTSSENEADLILVNMCSVRQSAVDRIFGISQKFSKLKIKNKKLKIILTGCILKEDKRKLVKKFDLILDIKDLPKLPFLLKNYITGFRSKYENNFSALVPISNGCDNFCSYCVVPFTRGHLVCRSHQEILKEIKNAVKNGLNPIRNAISNGAREIWLLGQNVNDYKSKVKSQKSKVKTTTKNLKIINFAKLLKMVNDVPGNFWIRFTSPNPADFSDETIETMARCKKITPYLNLPLQSGDDKILRKMNRKYTISPYKNLVKKIRAAFKKYRTGSEKEITLSTDIIVGFPGETKKQFENTVKLFKEIKYDMAYIAKYSPRPQTTASRLKDNVPRKEKERRYKILTEVLRKIALEKNKKFIGKEIEVLVEKCKNGSFFGKSRHYKTVKFQNPNDKCQIKSQIQNPKLIGQFVKVKITDTLPWGLKAELI